MTNTDSGTPTSNFGVGMGLRDCNRNYVKAMTSIVSGTPTPNEVEACALHSTIIWIKRLGLSNVVIETDCKTPVDCFQADTKNSIDFHVIFNSCRDLLSPISNFRVSFVKRHVNHVTHNLTRTSRFYVNFHVFDYILTCIIWHITNEII
ncbi:hypothetical protein JHK84_030146 [Glycine max]|nr:hypothetical protein JHK85_030544 [Glycine max]KAG5144603.1 hypothetical protein JHK84_030146 [Glycine max]